MAAVWRTETGSHYYSLKGATSKRETIRTAPFYQDMLTEIADEGERLLHEPIVTLP